MESRFWKEFIKPNKYRKHEESSDVYGKFSWEPLEKGFGITLGNALRRVLLSSIEGAALTGLKIDNVYHEFSTIPGVVEDMANVILNLKQIKLKVFSVEPQTLCLHINGPKEVRAKDIEATNNVEIVTPDAYICTIEPDASLDVELTAGRGRGYEPAKISSDVEGPIGFISIDAIYSPITKTTFSVTPARVGQRTDFDRLTLEVWTDGAITPEESITIAARILQDQLGVFVFFENGDMDGIEKKLSNVDPSMNENIYRKIDELDLSVRTANCLKTSNLQHVGDLVQKTEEELLKAKNFGKKSLSELKEVLAGMGLRLGMQVDSDKFYEEVKKVPAGQSS